MPYVCFGYKLYTGDIDYKELSKVLVVYMVYYIEYYGKFRVISVVNVDTAVLNLVDIYTMAGPR